MAHTIPGRSHFIFPKIQDPIDEVSVKNYTGEVDPDLTIFRGRGVDRISPDSAQRRFGNAIDTQDRVTDSNGNTVGTHMTGRLP